MSHTPESRARFYATAAKAMATFRRVRTGYCDCYDPECGYPHGRNRVGKLAEVHAAAADALAMHASVDFSLSHARAHVASVVKRRTPQPPPRETPDGTT
jgi:hypothetical protein